MHQTLHPSLDRALLRMVDGCLAGVVFGVPWLMGGRHAVGQLVLTALAVAAAWAWGTGQWVRAGGIHGPTPAGNRPAWRPAPGTLWWLMGGALLLLQIVPLPPSLLAWLSPRQAEVLSLWNASSPTLGAWQTISLAPFETRAGLVLFLDYALLFLVVVQRVGRIEDVERLLRWCALSALAMAAFGIVQLITSNGKFLWFYSSPYADTSGTATGCFTNRNHFAHFLALGAGPAVWWLQDVLRRSAAGGNASRMPVPRTLGMDAKGYFACAAIGIILFAGLLSLSRGGVMVLLLAVGISAVACFRTSSTLRRFAVALGVAVMLTGVALEIFGGDRVAWRLSDFTSGSLERLDNGAARRRIWTASVGAASDYPALGAGVGTFREVYPTYTDAICADELEYAYAESCYLQIPVETGLAGVVLTLWGIGMIGVWCFRACRGGVPPRLRVCASAVAASMVAAVVHAGVDFVWYVPACMAMVAVLAGCLLRVAQMAGKALATPGTGSLFGPSGSKNVPIPFGVPRFAWGAAVVVLTLCGGAMIAYQVGPALAQPPWDQYLAARYAMRTQPREALADGDVQRQWRDTLEKVLRWKPWHARAHLALAETHRWLFDIAQKTADNSMTVAHIRDAANRSRFRSAEALERWLSRAFGDAWHHLELARRQAEQAVRLSPLQGRGYVYLAELAFLSGGDATFGQACSRQALRVRPYDGAVLYAAATDALLAGDAAQWLDYARRAFHCSRQQRQRVIDDLVASAPSEDLPTLIVMFLREFQPDLEAMQALHAACSNRCSPEQLLPLRKRLAVQTEDQASALEGQEAAAAWLGAAELHLQIGGDPDALRCAAAAVKADPDNYRAHFRFGELLLRGQNFADAETQWRWCLQRRLNDPVVERNLRDAVKGRMKAPYRNAATDKHLQ
jgi:tetratricopeptide (TPR) repeat protein